MRLSVDEAFQRYGDRVFSAAFAVCHSREDADDADGSEEPTDTEQEDA